VGVGAVARDLRRPQCGPPRGRQPHLSLSTYKIGARGGERGSWEVVEKEREKDLGKVVTGGGEGTEAEGTEKANHRGTRRTRRKANHRAGRTRRWEKRGRTGWAAPTWRGIGLSIGRWVKGAQAWKARKPAPHRTRHRGHGKSKPQRTRRTRRKTNHGEHGGHGDGKRGGGLRWSAQSCGLDGVWSSRTGRDCVALPAGPPAWQAWRLAPRRHPVWQALRRAPRGTAPFREHARARRSQERGRTGWAAPTGHGIGWRRGRWVKGAQAGWKAGRRLESLPHIGHDTEGTEKANHRGHGGHGEKQTTENTEDTEMGKEAARSAQRRRARVSPWAD
jgi:hypothetical protein